MSSILDLFTTSSKQQLTQTRGNIVNSNEKSNNNNNRNMSPLSNSEISNNKKIVNSKPTTSPIQINQNNEELNRLKKLLNHNSINSNCNSHHANNRIKLRLLIFLEDSDGHRSNIFDSSKYNNNFKTEASSNNSPQNSSSSNSNNNKNFNTEMITRMVFGSFPMLVSTRTAIKVHSLKNSQKTMISNVFTYYNTSSAISNSNQFKKPLPVHTSCSCNKSTTKCQLIRRQSVQSDNVTTKNNLLITKGHKNKDSSSSSSIDFENNSNSNQTQLNNSNSISSSYQSTSNCLFVNTNLNHNNSNKSCSPSSSISRQNNSNTTTNYCGMYRRLMRSLSNSLISSHSVTTLTNGSSTLDNYFNENLDDTKQSIKNSDNNSICGKCIENSCYPKFKIGIAVIYYIPKEKSNSTNLSRQSSSSLTPSSPTHLTSNNSNNSNGNSSPLKTPKLTNINFDPLTLFPSSPNSNNKENNTNNSNNNNSSLIESPTTTILNDSTTSTSQSTTNNNNLINKDHVNVDEFFEFFFSHLPLIEYQFKELKDKCLNNILPLYFHSNNHNNNHHHHYRQQSSSTINGNHNNHMRYSLSNSYTSTNSNSSSISSVSHHQNNNNQAQSNLNQINFIHLMLQLYQDYENRFNLLFDSPRLPNPAWLTIINSKKQANSSSTNNVDAKPSVTENSNNCYNLTCSNLINDLIHINKKLSNEPNSSTSASTSSSLLNKKRLIINNIISTFSPNGGGFGGSSSSSSTTFSYLESKMAENELLIRKNRQQFLGRLLSTILKYHLSWVYTVLPGLNPTLQNITKLKTKFLRKNYANWTHILEKTNPYNPLWAQLSDLHGAINDPLKLVRCVLVGQNRDLIEKLLNLLSYFIRCGNSSYYDILIDNNIDLENLIQSNTKSTNGESLSETSSSSSSSSNNSSKIILNLNHQPFAFSPQNNPNNINGSIPFSSSSSSSSSSSDSNHHQKMSSAKELPLLESQIKPNKFKSQRIQDNFGYSLLGSYCEKFVFEYVLHGTSDRTFLTNLNEQLKFSQKNSILDTKIDESIYIVVDVDSYEIMLYSSNSINSEYTVIDTSINMVDQMLKSVVNMIKLFQNSEFVLLHLEDLLQEFYVKSLTLNQLTMTNTNSTSPCLDDKNIMDLMDLSDRNDLDFLRRVLASVQLNTN